MWFVWKRGCYGASSSPLFGVARTCDGTGTPTTAGFSFYVTSTSSTLGATIPYRHSFISALIADAQGFCLFPGGNTTTIVAGGPQVMRHFMYTPEIRCVPFFLSYLNTEATDLIPFTATPVSTQYTYLPLGGTAGPSSCGMGGGTTVSDARLACVWQ